MSEKKSSNTKSLTKELPYSIIHQKFLQWEHIYDANLLNLIHSYNQFEHDFEHIIKLKLQWMYPVLPVTSLVFKYACLWGNIQILENTLSLFVFQSAQKKNKFFAESLLFACKRGTSSSTTQTLQWLFDHGVILDSQRDFNSCLETLCESQSMDEYALSLSSTFPFSTSLSPPPIVTNFQLFLQHNQYQGQHGQIKYYCQVDWPTVFITSCSGGHLELVQWALEELKGRSLSFTSTTSTTFTLATPLITNTTTSTFAATTTFTSASTTSAPTTATTTPTNRVLVNLTTLNRGFVQAAVSGHLHIIQYLLNHEPSISDFENGAFAAIVFKHYHVIGYLIQYYPEKLYCRGIDKPSWIDFLSNIYQYGIEKGIQKSQHSLSVFFLQDYDLLRFVQNICHSGNVEILKSLMTTYQGTSLELVFKRSLCDSLYWACLSGNLETVSYVVECGLVEKMIMDWSKGFYGACENGNVFVFEYLLQYFSPPVVLIQSFLKNMQFLNFQQYLKHYLKQKFSENKPSKVYHLRSHYKNKVMI